jgi:PhzF family phenazine biosynthesis protein
MKLVQYQVDAFAEHVFEGNPAAVCPLDSWLDDELMQAIAAENNLSETAFFVPSGDGFHLRWFTPKAEVRLCGHATLASAHVLFDILGYSGEAIAFETLSGTLTVARKDGALAMDFPAIVAKPCPTPAALSEALGRAPLEVLAADDYLAVFDSEATVRALAPDMGKLASLDLRGVCVTAAGGGASGADGAGETIDFVSRFFAPKYGVPEDPVTGSAHCKLTPYWAARLGKTRLHAKQVSRRGGRVLCELRGDRVILSGTAVTFMRGEIHVPM